MIEKSVLDRIQRLKNLHAFIGGDYTVGRNGALAIIDELLACIIKPAPPETIEERLDKLYSLFEIHIGQIDILNNRVKVLEDEK